jgi:hypothetical protein
MTLYYRPILKILVYSIMAYSGHKYHQFDTTSQMARSNVEEIHSFNFKKAPKERLVPVHPGNMPGTTISVSVANRATNSRNNYICPNPPDIMRMTKGCKIVGIL